MRDMKGQSLEDSFDNSLNSSEKFRIREKNVEVVTFQQASWLKIPLLVRVEEQYTKCEGCRKHEGLVITGSSYDEGQKIFDS